MRAWLEQRTLAEKRLLGTAALVIAGALYFLLVLEPLTGANARLRTQIGAASDLEAHLAAMSQELARLHGGGSTGASFPPDAALLSVLTTSASAEGLQAYTRKMAPLGPHVVSLMLEGVPFPALAAWLVKLDREQGVEVERVAVSAAKASGAVDVQLSLKARGLGP